MITSECEDVTSISLLMIYLQFKILPGKHIVLRNNVFSYRLYILHKKLNPFSLIFLERIFVGKEGSISADVSINSSTLVSDTAL